MSDLSLQLQQAESQLPVSSYSSPAVFDAEMARIFSLAPRYVGHAQEVPNVGDFATLAHEGHGRALVRTQKGVELVSNICRHRQAIMLQGTGKLASNDTPGAGGGNIVCPLHRWTYAPSGELIGAPQFAQDPCLNLRNYPLRQWQGLLFEDNGRMPASDLAHLNCAPELDFSGYVLARTHTHTCHYNWKTFIEVYLEDLHVGPAHPGLGQFVSCDDLHWQFTPHYSVQTVGIKSALANPGSAIYQRWHDAVLKHTGGKSPAHGAIWLTYYPQVMVEWYPEVLVVSSLTPIGPELTENRVQFFYPEAIAAFEPEFMAAQQAAYLETCHEDDDIAQRMDAGRKALAKRGDNEVGPYQSPLEAGMQHFHEWYRANMGAIGSTGLPDAADGAGLPV